MTRVKICGLTNLEDALMSVAAGAEMLGFNFCPASPRYVHPDAVRVITREMPPHIECVGVFADEASPNAVRSIAIRAGIHSVQLHGHENAEYCEALRDLNVIKAVRVRAGFRAEHLHTFRKFRLLLDADANALGGSGKTFDWKLAEEVSTMAREVLLAGGLHGGNVEEALSVISADAVDACSRMESSPGHKDRAKVEAFIRAVRRHDAAAGVFAAGTVAQPAHSEERNAY